MIATAFADFRSYIPFFVPYSERPYYYSYFGFGSSVKDEKKLDERLIIDIEGTFLTAIQEGIDVLVLGAGGCGAFCHDAKRDAKLWKEVITEFGSHFSHISFAILPDPVRPYNLSAFRDQFKANV